MEQRSRFRRWWRSQQPRKRARTSLLGAIAVVLFAASSGCGSTTTATVNPIPSPTHRSPSPTHRSPSPTFRSPTPSPKIATIQVAVGSEDKAFLLDSQAVTVFRHYGLIVKPVSFGSGQLAFTEPEKPYSAFFLSSVSFAQMAETRLRITAPSLPEPFSTPLVVLTWQPLIPLLQRLGIVNRDMQFDVGRYMAVARTGVRWNRIPGNTFYRNTGQVLLDMTSPKDSDSGGMFAAVASYALNGDNLLTQKSQVEPIAAQIAAVLSPLGQPQPTTHLLFQQYLTEQMAGEPLVVSYQSEFTTAERSHALPPLAVMLQLTVPVDCIHTVLTFDSNGVQFADALNDPVLQRLVSTKYGFLDATHSPGAGNTHVPGPDIMKELVYDASPYS
jgi:hypothetical protein